MIRKLLIACMMFASTMVFSNDFRYYVPRNLYFRVDVTSGNAILSAASSIIGGLTNYWVNYPLYDNSFSYTFVDWTHEDRCINTKNNYVLGLTPSELFNDFQGGVKIGYQTFSPEFFNIGIYVSAHYKINQFLVDMDGAYRNYQLQRSLLGLNVMTTFGRMDYSVRVVFEAGLRYCIGNNTKATEMFHLSNGLISQYAIRIKGSQDIMMLQDLGFFIDVQHPNFSQSQRSFDDCLNLFSFGVSWVLTPAKIESLMD